MSTHAVDGKHRARVIPSRTGGLRAALRARLRSRLQGRRLDRELACGKDPSSSEALELRARHLLSEMVRGRLADGLETAVRRASSPPVFSSKAPVNRRGVRMAGPEILAMAAELRENADCDPRGVALAERLLTDGASPLYSRASDRELLTSVRNASLALKRGAGA
jgi:hypothetical protein